MVQNYTKPEILDPILTMGFPPIQGFTEAVQVAETATISANQTSTIGQIAGHGIHYQGGMKDHFLVSARVKGGNSGGPVINRIGQVVGMIIESLLNNDSADLLGYGVALSSAVIEDTFVVISGKRNTLPVSKLPFRMEKQGFILQ